MALTVRIAPLLLLLFLASGCAARAEPLPVPPSATPTRPAATPAVAADRAAPSATAQPTTPIPVATASPSPTPAPRLWQLTVGGCCVHPDWRADSRAVRFLDRPPGSEVGIYEVPLAVTAPLAVGELVSRRLGAWELADRYFVAPLGEQVEVEVLATGERWSVPSGGERVTISPDGRLLAWQRVDPDSTVPFNQRATELWLANLDGSEARLLLRMRGGFFTGWLGEHDMLLTMVDDNAPDQRLLLRYSPDDGATTRLASGARISGVAISPGGGHVAYMISLDRDSPERNGLWVTDATSGASERLPIVGAYRWRDGGSLLMIPMERDAASHRLAAYDLATRRLRPLTDPDRLPFRVAYNDWAVSPDGRHVVLVSAADNNLWVIALE